MSDRYTYQPPEYLGDMFPPDVIATHEQHARDVAIIAAAASDKAMEKYLAALTRFYYPDVAADIISVAPLATFTTSFPFPGIIRLKKLEMFAPGGTYPSRVDVVIDKISHQPFTLTPAIPTRGPYAFQIVGGAFVTFTNADAANAANVYIEWEMVNYG